MLHLIKALPLPLKPENDSLLQVLMKFFTSFLQIALVKHSFSLSAYQYSSVLKTNDIFVYLA